jgi:hypothetical protein
MEKQAGNADPEANMAIVNDIGAALAARKRVGCFHYKDGQYYPFARQ